MDASGFWFISFFSGFFFRSFLVCLSFYFSIATALTLSLFFLVWKILRRRLERFQKHIEHRDLFELLSGIVHVLIWLLLALSCLDMVFRTVHVVEKKRNIDLNYFTSYIFSKSRLNEGGIFLKISCYFIVLKWNFKNLSYKKTIGKETFFWKG